VEGPDLEQLIACKQYNAENSNSCLPKHLIQFEHDDAASALSSSSQQFPLLEEIVHVQLL